MLQSIHVTLDQEKDSEGPLTELDQENPVKTGKIILTSKHLILNI